MSQFKNIKFKPADTAAVESAISRIKSEPASKEELKLALSLIDLTTLEGKDTAMKVKEMCRKAVESGTAAVCVYPALVSIAKSELNNSSQKVASVAGGFPAGQLPLNLRLAEAKYAIEQGADEIDMVISRGRFLEGDHEFVYDEVAAFKSVCGAVKLKVILETGELETLDNIRLASDIAINAGADFIKTSTGKIPVNATLQTMCVMLQAISDYYKETGIKCGIKPSGGISDGNTAAQYLRLTESIVGKEWLQPSLFRIGASRLVDTLIAEISGKEHTNAKKDGY
ncbi:MAG: deoxyribose-phosphate aldolase [Bacteroidetes bacterium]|nr:deoxyribose-phosphate aldolase [Bacteroidota bacterium]